MEYLGLYRGSCAEVKEKNVIHIIRSKYQKIAIYDTKFFGRCLYLDGIIQCSEYDHEEYDKAILRKLKPTDKSILILGGGDGQVAQMAIKLNPLTKITIVEHDISVIITCKKFLNQKIFDHPNVNVLVDDAMHFLETINNIKYDYIICDFTDYPNGFSEIGFREFFSRLFSLSARILNNSSWISAYLGCNESIANSLICPQFCYLEKSTIFLSSFGEKCFFIYSQIKKNNSVPIGGD